MKRIGFTGKGLNIFESKGPLKEIVIRYEPTDQTMSREKKIEWAGKHIAKVINESIQSHIDGVFTLKVQIGLKGDKVWFDDISLKKTLVS